MLLTLTAELNGVTDLTPVDTEETPFLYHLRLKCTSCREDHPNAVPTSRFDEADISGSKGTANLVIKCRNCGKEGNINILSGPFPYSGLAPQKSATGKSKSGNTTRQKFLEFDTRGLEVTGFDAVGDFTCSGLESGTKFEGVEISEGEWYEYDEKVGEEVSIVGVSWEVRKNV